LNASSSPWYQTPSRSRASTIARTSPRLPWRWLSATTWEDRAVRAVRWRRTRLRRFGSRPRCYEGTEASARAWLEVACVAYLFARPVAGDRRPRSRVARWSTRWCLLRWACSSSSSPSGSGGCGRGRGPWVSCSGPSGPQSGRGSMWVRVTERHRRACARPGPECPVVAPPGLQTPSSGPRSRRASTTGLARGTDGPSATGPR